MKEYRVRKARPIATELHVPGDLDISHHAVLVAALANGPSVISGFLPAEECLDTVQACRALGVKIDFLSEEDSDLPWDPDEKGGTGPTRLRVHGVSMKLHAPSGAVDCGHSLPALTLLAGLVSGQPFETRLLAGDTVSRESLKEIIPFLEKMGASIRTGGPEKTGPLTIQGRADLKTVEVTGLLRSPLAKPALLFAGLMAGGKSSVVQRPGTRDHMERILRHFQVKTRREGKSVVVYGGQVPESRDLRVPGDISYAANWIVAAASQPGSDLVIRDVGLNETRTGFLRVLLRMGARILEDIHHSRDGEPFGNVIVRGTVLQGTVIKEEEVTGLHGELPALAIAGALAAGTTVIHRTPEAADRLDRIAHNLRLMGVVVSAREHGIEITGSRGAPLQPGCVPGGGDARIAMAFATAGLFAEGETIVEDVSCVHYVYPAFADDLRRFQDRSISGGSYTPVISPVPAAGKK